MAKCKYKNHDLIEGMPCDQDNREIIAFLYVLIRDHITSGNLEQIILEACKEPDCCYTNGYLVEYARNIAKRLNCLQGGDKE